MSKYRVEITLQPIAYEVEAESEEKAVEMARDIFFEESHYDILKYADYDTEEMEA